MINSWSRVLATTLLVVTLVVALLMATAWSLLPLDNIGLTLHGETFSLADLHGTSAVLFFVVAVAAILIALIATVIAVVVGLAFAALGIAIGLLATVAALTLVAAPFALIVWALWRLVRTRSTPAITGP
jgi:hypothetical protein